MFGRTVHSPWFLRKCAGRSNEQAGILGAGHGYPCLASKDPPPVAGERTSGSTAGVVVSGDDGPGPLLAPSGRACGAPGSRACETTTCSPVLAAPRRSSEGRCAPPPQVIVARSRRGT